MCFSNRLNHSSHCWRNFSGDDTRGKVSLWSSYAVVHPSSRASSSSSHGTWCVKFPF